MSLTMPPESIGKVHKALAYYIMMNIEDDIVKTFDNIEKIYYSLLKKETEERWEDYTNTCNRRQYAAQKREQEKKGAQLCTIVPNTIQNNTIQNNTEESNINILSSSRITRDARRDDEKNIISDILSVPFETRKNDFYKSIVNDERLKNRYDRQTLDGFCAYYTQPVEENGLMLWEDLKYNPQPGKRGTFSASHRLIWWVNNNRHKQ